MNSILLRFALVFPLIAVAAFAADESAAAPADSSAMRLEELLWREVQNPEGKTLGTLSDVLVQMPTGRMVFVAVVPSGFYGRPKVMPPGALKVPDRPEAPLQLDIGHERWLEAPELDWNAELVIKHTEDGAKIYAYYQQLWIEPQPGAELTGMEVVVPERDVTSLERYVSLKGLLLDRVATPLEQQTGFVTDFVIDWPERRATYALVSPRFTPIAEPDEMWFAVPVPLLAPPVEQDALTINSEVAAFRRAPRAADVGALPMDNQTRIYRYPSPKLAQQPRQGSAVAE